MNINLIKKELNKYLDKKILIKYNLGRNKYEKYQGKIKKLYNNIFLVEVVNNDKKIVKSFSYSDIITKTIKIEIIF